MKLRHGLMILGIAIGGWLALFGDKTPNGSVSEPVARQTANTKHAAPSKAEPHVAAPATTQDNNTTAATPRKSKAKAEPVIQVLRDREALIGGKPDHGVDLPKVPPLQPSTGLFASQSWLPPPPPPPKPSPPPPPTAPPVPFTFIGKKLEDKVWEVYLARGDNTFIVQEKTVIEATYRIESIKPPTLTLTYLPLNQQQTLPIGGTE